MSKLKPFVIGGAFFYISFLASFPSDVDSLSPDFWIFAVPGSQNRGSCECLPNGRRLQRRPCGLFFSSVCWISLDSSKNSRTRLGCTKSWFIINQLLFNVSSWWWILAVPAADVCGVGLMALASRLPNRMTCCCCWCCCCRLCCCRCRCWTGVDFELMFLIGICGLHHGLWQMMIQNW